MPYKIYRKNANTVIDYASNELKKYLRMMMPRCGEIPVSFAPDASDGFRLGVMSDFGMTADVENIRLDDAVYIDTDENGGVIAGSNERSVLIAVYRYLRENGCRWLFPGPDGEDIPVVESLKPVKLSHKADHRYRGQCNEGAESQQIMLEAIEFTPKIGMNTFMIEFDIPQAYYRRYYEHRYDRYTETLVSDEKVLQWKRQCETELSRRGLLFHDMGHGWTAEPFGISSVDGWKASDESTLTDDSRRHLAMINGKRGFFQGVPLNTNLCLSNPETRSIVAKYVAQYAQNQNNVDFLHVWLADSSNNHCECDNCRKKDVSDWYMILMNDIDRELTARGLDTHIVFIAYIDTLWAPKTEKIMNTDRFTMLFAPITRLYNESYGDDMKESAVVPYNRNKLVFPKGMSATMDYLREWKKSWKGDCFCYEYHFWLTQYYDLGIINIARTIYNDIKGLHSHGLSGIVEDGSQRSFYPNGFAFYVYGEMLFDSSRSFEELTEDFFSHAYGKDWKLVADYLQKLSDTSDFDYMSGYSSADEDVGKYYNPSVVEKFSALPAIIDEFLPVIDAHLKTDNRASYICWEMLRYHGGFCKKLSSALCLKAVNRQEEAFDEFEKSYDDMQYLDFLRTSAYDQFMCVSALRRIFKVAYGEKRPEAVFISQ